MCIFFIYWEFHHANWRTHIFQKGRSTTNQWYNVSCIATNDREVFPSRQAPQPAAAFAARRRGEQRRHGALGHSGALAAGAEAGDDQAGASWGS